MRDVLLAFGRFARVKAHRAGQVGRADHAAVNAGHGHDRFSVFNRLNGFELRCHKKLLVDPVHIVVAVGQRASPAIRAIPHPRRVAASPGNCARFLNRIHHRHDDAHSARVEQLADERKKIVRNARERHRRVGVYGRRAG